jgi:riboflavin biosynthesis pyrimidine reductase
MIAAALYDEIHLIVCPFVLGGSNSITPVERTPFWPKKDIPWYRLAGADVLGDYLHIVYQP